jgi:hypothetical protein
VEHLEIETAEARFQRIILDDTGAPPIPVTGSWLVSPANAASEARPLSQARLVRREEYAGETVLTIDLGAANLSVGTIGLVSSEAVFARPVSVRVREWRDEQVSEKIVATGTLFRLDLGAGERVERMDVQVDRLVPARELLVYVSNGDSPVLSFGDVTVTYRPAKLVWHAPQVGEYTLWLGHAGVRTPRFDLAGLAQELRMRPVQPATLGPLQENANYQRPDSLPEAAIQGAPIDPAPWRHRRSVQVEPSGVQRLELDLEVLARAGLHYQDLRLVRDGHQLPYVLERPALVRSVDVEPVPTTDAGVGRSRWQLALPEANLPLSRLTLSAGTGTFQRRVRVYERVRDARRGDYEIERASILWTRAPGGEGASLVVPLTGRLVTDTLWVETNDGDNLPITLTRSEIAYPVVRLLFKADAGPVDLLYGNPGVSAPRYDLALFSAQLAAATQHVAILGPPDGSNRNDARDARLRGGIIFWSALILVVVCLLVLVAKLLPKPDRSAAVADGRDGPP